MHTTRTEQCQLINDEPSVEKGQENTPPYNPRTVFNSTGQDDHLISWPGHPQRWPARQKWLNIALISVQAALTPISATILAIANVAIAEDFGLTDNYTPSLPVGLFILGNGFGPLYLAPLSELYGRRIVYLLSFSLFACLHLGCALAPNITALSILRFFAGMAGSAASTLSGASVGDLFTARERGRAQSIYGAAPLLGPVVGGIIGGFIVQGTRSWRWTMWLMAICPGISVCLCLIFLRETYAPVLWLKDHQRSREWPTAPSPGLTNLMESTSPTELFHQALSRPLRLLVFSPICTIMSVYTGFAFGVFYFHIVTLSLLFSPEPVRGLPSYGWSEGTSGLSYLGIGVGSVVGVLLSSLFLNRSYDHTRAYIAERDQKWRAKDGVERGVSRSSVAGALPSSSPSSSLSSPPTTQNQGRRPDMEQSSCPEARLPFLLLAMLVAPMGLLIFALTAGPPRPWIAPLIGAGVFAAGMVPGYICIQNYLVDSYETHSASALATCSLLRSILGCILSMVGWQAYQTLGYRTGTLMLMAVMLAFAIGPIVLWRWGQMLRKGDR